MSNVVKDCLLPTSTEAKILATMFNRRLTTNWSEKEVKTFKKLRPFDREELDMVERYYNSNWPPRHGVNILRTTLEIFLNHYPGEVDRARVWCQRHPLPGARKARATNGALPEIVQEPVDPETLASFRRAFASRTGRNLYGEKA